MQTYYGHIEDVHVTF